MSKKDKFFGIIGIVLFFVTIIIAKVFTVYNIVEEKGFITLVFIILMLLGIGMSRKYLINLFEEGMRGKK